MGHCLDFRLMWEGHPCTGGSDSVRKTAETSNVAHLVEPLPNALETLGLIPKKDSLATESKSVSSISPWPLL